MFKNFMKRFELQTDKHIERQFGYTMINGQSYRVHDFTSEYLMCDHYVFTPIFGTFSGIITLRGYETPFRVGDYVLLKNKEHANGSTTRYRVRSFDIAFEVLAVSLELAPRIDDF